MSYINKSISSAFIVYRLGRIFKNNTTEFHKFILELVGDAVSEIGYHIGFEDKTTQDDEPVNVTNHRAPIPPDVERITGVEYYTNYKEGDNIIDAYGNPVTNPDSGIQLTKKLNLGADNKSRDLNSETTKDYKHTGQPFYYLNGNFIITSFVEGRLRLHYKGFAIDDKGFPLIVDDQSYRQAILYYCISQLILEGYKHPEISFSDAHNLYDNKYLPRARNCGKMPSIDGMARFNASFHRLTQSLDIEQEFFENHEVYQSYN